MGKEGLVVGSNTNLSSVREFASKLRDDQLVGAKKIGDGKVILFVRTGKPSSEIDSSISKSELRKSNQHLVRDTIRQVIQSTRDGANASSASERALLGHFSDLLSHDKVVINGKALKTLSMFADSATRSADMERPAARATQGLKTFHEGPQLKELAGAALDGAVETSASPHADHRSGYSDHRRCRF